MKQALAAPYHVNLISLAPEYQSKFSNQAAVNFVNTVLGMPYGWHNFIFTFLDVVDGNLPRPITPDLFEVVFGLAERSIPFDSKGSVYNMLIQGLNQRLATACTTLQCIYETIDPKKMSLLQASSIPEQDSWRYEGNRSLVCDVFVTEVLQAGGALPFSFQATEQTPKDLYQMQIWDVGFDRLPRPCLESNPELPFCQIMGDYVFTLPGLSSIPIYPSMNNICPALSPQFYRTPGC